MIKNEDAMKDSMDQELLRSKDHLFNEKDSKIKELEDRVKELEEDLDIALDELNELRG